jgi:putative hydrolase of HD superfamily
MHQQNINDDCATVIVQQQLDAYNQRDIDAFMQCWDDDCHYYEFPDRLLAAGKDQSRTRHVERFKDRSLFGALLQRMHAGDIVIDQEIVTRTLPEGLSEIEVIAIYQLRNEKIINAWFKFGATTTIASSSDQ